jgi:hypothetical protein
MYNLTNADPVRAACERKFFSEWIQNFETGQIHIETFPIPRAIGSSNDGSHIPKRRRSRFAKSSELFLRENASQSARAKEILHLGDFLNPSALDDRAFVRMDDWHCGQVYSSQVLQNIISTGNQCLILYLLPGVGVNNAMRDQNPSRGQRRDICYLGLFLMLFIYE